MSLVYITFHNENIRDIERQTAAEHHYKFPKHVSIHRKRIENAPVDQIDEQGKKVISASNKHLHKTMGYAETPLDNPCNYLKKDGGVKWKRFNNHVCPPSKGLPPVPRKNQIPQKPDRKKVNFIKKNIKRTKTAVCPNLRDKYVDSVNGQRHNLDGTGLVPEHIYSEQYGKPPDYLKDIKKSLASRIYCKQMKQKDTSQGIRPLSDSERKTILMGLRANHLELEKTYRLLPLFIDTNPKKLRKAKLEQELKRLEQDILLMESNPVILVCEE